MTLTELRQLAERTAAGPGRSEMHADPATILALLDCIAAADEMRGDVACGNAMDAYDAAREKLEAHK